jgi:hypothetical protein
MHRWSVWIVVLISVATSAQQIPGPQPAPDPEKEATAKLSVLGSPRIQLTYDFEHTAPSHYELAIDREGKGTYYAADAETSFQVSAVTRDRIFVLVHALNDLDGDFDYKKTRISFSGTKALTYIDGAAKHTTSVNWSENKDMTELLAILQGMASTLNARFELRRLRKHDRLGLNAYLASLEKQADMGWLRELNLISDVLGELAKDPSVMDMARHRAGRLLAKAQTR